MFKKLDLIKNNYTNLISKSEFMSQKYKTEIYEFNLNKVDEIGSGNKLAKLEYLLKYSIDNNYRNLVIDGDRESVSAYSLAYYGKRYKIKIHFVSSGKSGGNNYPRLKKLNIKEYYIGNWALEKVKNKILQLLKTLPDSLYVSSGASHPITLLGSLEIGKAISDFERKQKKKVDIIILPIGSGGTIFGIGFYKEKYKKKWKVTGISTYNPADYFLKQYRASLTWLETKKLIPKQGRQALPFEINTKYLKSGHTSFGEDDLKIIKEYNLNGISLDRIYTIRCINYLEANYPKLKGKKVLFINT